jgi:hypothetical protein
MAHSEVINSEMAQQYHDPLKPVKVMTKEASPVNCVQNQNKISEHNSEGSEGGSDSGDESDSGSFCDCQECRDHNLKMQQLAEAKMILASTNENDLMSEFEIKRKDHCSDCDVFITLQDNQLLHI